jgi:hypothetical protein
VEANVRWFVESEGSAQFNLPGPLDIRTRRVRFKTSGIYWLWAESHSWGGGQVKSNVLEMMITDK